MIERSVPFDLQAERATLGSILLERDALVAVADWLSPQDFYLEKHALVYTAMCACLARREPPDLATVAIELRRTERLDLVGGSSFLADVATEVPAAVHIEYYARTVERTATLRRLIMCGGDIAALGYDESRDIEETLDQAESALFRVTQRRQRSDVDGADVSVAISDWWQHISRMQDGDISPGLLTGWGDLDRVLLLEPAMLHVLAARPGVGKSAVALALARNVAQAGERVLYFSLEMKRLALLNRMAAMESGVDADRLRRGTLSDWELRALSEAAGRIGEWPIHICDRFALTATGLRGYARRQQAQRPISLIIADHLGLLVPPKAENRNVAVSDLSRGLVHLAGELGVPILALSQLNRETERRASHVPMLSDLRDSGAVEQDAASVTFLYRPAMYDDQADPGLMEFHIAKQRNGVLAVVPMRFDPRTMAVRTPPSAYKALEGYDDDEGYQRAA